MRRLLALTLLVGVAACKDSTGPTGPTWTKWASTAWEYAYSAPGYTEGLSGVAGQLVIERSSTDSARVSSIGDVVIAFWGKDSASVDTVRTNGAVWHADYVLNGVVTPGDTFTFTSSTNPQAWPTFGTYVVQKDSLRFTWDAASTTEHLHLVIHFARVP